MTDVSKIEEDFQIVQAVLRGGPSSIPAALRVQEVSALAEKIKVPHLGGYEHFNRSSPIEGAASGQVLFHWTMRTEIAELTAGFAPCRNGLPGCW